MNWHETILGKNITTKKGFAFKSTKYVDSGVPIVRVSDFTSDSISANDLKYYPKEEKYTYLDYELHYKDIIIQTVGSWPNNPDSVVGKVVRVPYELNNALLNQNAVKIIPNEGMDNDFLYYRLKSSDFSGHVVGQARGAANQASITLETIKSFKFFIPNYNVQIKIGKVISQYDRLLETNKKRIKILEQMAENLYKEWFVRFRFPGHEKAEFVDGVPKGWKVCKLKDIIKFNPKYDFKQQYSYINIPMAALSTFGMSIDKSQITIEEKSSGTHFVNGDVLFAKITPCLENGKTGLVNCLNDDEVGTGSTEFIVMHGVKVDSFFTYCIARDELFRKQAINSMNGADGRQRADLAFIKKIKWLLPSDELLVRFKRFTDSVIKQIEMFNKQNQNLIKQRDYLLPRLMSGKLQV
ncbi:type I restriction enzyme, S subunit [Anaerovibrio lipolyticus DSM 3074]|uniref:Type I restriction enzyme, S subunit n=1 Tax=Anaerovibrio lipolyticus DSM 3074 TaxID=1120997 RepID=A0A1M6DS05_9FIRM|nr:restriction endonuclease subunit S [Anaerovibrio lipolyticus]SHI75963.1 type I restriction enzyme, S subunit [Anaerovibrio lipolyticus DSM 3074]